MAKLNVNGRVVEVAVDPDTPLLWAIRDHVGLTGTKYGCGVAACGACTVQVDGQAIRSCAMPVSAFSETQRIITIEGLSPDGNHPIQRAWRELDVPQCGFCQSGMIMAAAALLAEKPRPTDADIDQAMTNICRCGTYNRVRAGIHAAVRAGTSG
jgi:isoquinoline 1-oxidoreductase subunit alpha